MDSPIAVGVITLGSKPVGGAIAKSKRNHLVIRHRVRCRGGCQCILEIRVQLYPII